MDYTPNNQTQTPPYQPQSVSPEQPQKDKFRDVHYHYHHDRRNFWFARFFWGLLVILVGVMFLAKSLGFVSNNINWGVVFSHLWPVLIIFAGLSIMSRGGFFSGLVSSVLMLVLMATIVIWFFRIPLQGHIGGKFYRLDPAQMQSLMEKNR